MKTMMVAFDAPLLLAITTTRRFITQELWLIPVDQVCCFQAAISKTRSSILSGEGLMRRQGRSPFLFCNLPEAIARFNQTPWQFHQLKQIPPGTAITACYYHKTPLYYSRIVAISAKRSMLFSGGDFLKTLSSILSGEGFDEGEQGESPF